MFFYGIGIGFEKKNWYWKKYWYWFRKILVSKKFRIRFCSYFGFRHTLLEAEQILDNSSKALASQFHNLKYECDPDDEQRWLKNVSKLQ